MSFTSKASNFSIPADYRDYLAEVSSQFERLSQSQRSSNNKNGKNVMEDVYESMVKDVKALTSDEPPHLHTLVKKANGILKLSQFSNQQQAQSKNARPVTAAPDLESFDYDDFFFEVENRNNKLGTKFRTHLGKNQNEILSKLASNGGDFSQIWNDFEAVSSQAPGSENVTTTRPPSRDKMSRSSVVSNNVSGRSTGFSAPKRPRWQYFANSNGLSSSSNTSIASSISSNLSSTLSNFKRNVGSSGQRPATAAAQKYNKSDYMKHVFVVKGQVVAFKAHEFGQCTNWFGDEDLLKACRAYRGLFERELDLSGFNNSEIRIKLHEGYKLVVEAYRPVRDGLPPLRHKSTILLPDEVSVDKLIMCRTANGRLIIIHTEFPVVENKKKKKK